MAQLVSSKENYIELFRKNGFNCFPIPAGTKVADHRYNASKTMLNQPIQENENYGYIPLTGTGTAIIDFDNKERYRPFAEHVISKGYMVIETPHGWHIPVKDLIGKISKIELFDYGFQPDKKIVEIQGPYHYCVGIGSQIPDEDTQQMMTYVNRGTDKIWDAGGKDFHQLIDELCRQCKVRSRKRKSTSSYGNMRKRFRDGKPPTKGTSNDYFFQAALQCNTNGLTREEALEKIKTVYDKWEQSNEFSERPWSNIEAKIDDVYDNDRKLETGRPRDSSTELDRTERREDAYDDEKTYDNEDFDLAAREILERYNFVTLRENKEIYFYDTIEGIYKPYGNTIIEETCQRLIDKCKNKTVSEIIETIRRQTYIAQKDLESRIITVQNGILDTKTFELKAHGPEYLSTTKLPFIVNKDAKNLKLWNHILTIIDPKDINLILELLWMVISWNNSFKKMFIFKGLSDTQKTALANIIVMIIGKQNVATQSINAYLSRNSRFGTSKFIGRRMNIATEIGNITKEQLEMQKALVGGESQNTEKKNDNNEYVFDPTRFVFLFTTNLLGDIFASINDDSIVRRIQFIIFRNKIDGSKVNGDWLETFFTDANDRETAISTLVNVVINYKKAQARGRIPNTRWSTIEETRKILQNELPLEDKYFLDERLVRKNGSKLTMDEIHEDFQRFVGYKVSRQDMGYILKKNGLESSQSNGQTVYKGWAFNIPKEQSLLEK